MALNTDDLSLSSGIAPHRSPLKPLFTVHTLCNELLSHASHCDKCLSHQGKQTNKKVPCLPSLCKWQSDLNHTLNDVRETHTVLKEREMSRDPDKEEVVYFRASLVVQ